MIMYRHTSPPPSLDWWLVGLLLALFLAWAFAFG